MRGKILVIWKRLQVGDVLTAQLDRSRCNGKKPADKIEQRRLACPVRANHGMTFTLLHIERHAIDNRSLPEALVNVLQAQ
jgi:hypothetical protein